MKKLISFFASLAIFAASANAISFNSQFRASETSPFVLQFGPDLIMGGATTAFFATSYIIGHNGTLPPWDGTIYSKEDVNSFDRFFMQPYNHKLHQIGTFTCVTDMIAPAIVFGTEAIFNKLPAKELITIGTMYLESFMLAYGIKDCSKVIVKRIRPYMYFEGYPQDKVDDFDFEKSFPSGHTTNSFLAAAFTTYVFGKYYPEGWQKWAVGISTFGIAAATGCLRIASGNHFPTDVLTGAAIGTLCGFIVPFIHHQMLKNTPMLIIGNSQIKVEPTINGISFTCSL